MEIYNVDVYTDLNEYLTLTIQANDPREAEAIAQSMVENGEAECVGYTVGLNTPYSNSISPACTFTYHSFMIEVNKRVYLDENTLRLSPQAQKLKSILSKIYNSLITKLRRN